MIKQFVTLFLIRMLTSLFHVLSTSNLIGINGKKKTYQVIIHTCSSVWEYLDIYSFITQ